MGAHMAYRQAQMDHLRRLGEVARLQQQEVAQQGRIQILHEHLRMIQQRIGENPQMAALYEERAQAHNREVQIAARLRLERDAIMQRAEQARQHLAGAAPAPAAQQGVNIFLNAYQVRNDAQVAAGGLPRLPAQVLRRNPPRNQPPPQAVRRPVVRNPRR